MIRSNRLVISGGTFINHQGGPSETTFRELGKLAVLSATHDSKEVFDRPKCHENTRVAVLGRLWNWTNNGEEIETRPKSEEIPVPELAVGDLTKSVMWVYGDAGAGKSALAQSHAERCARERCLLGGFFFSRNDSRRSTYTNLVATIAYQAAISSPGLKDLIVAAIEQDPSIFEKALESQFATLIVDPINALLNHPQPLPHLIILDGLDECSPDDRRQQCYILKVIWKSILRCNIGLKVLIASRAENEIRSSFDSPSLKNLSTLLALDASFHPDDDISLFLNDTFRDIKETHPLRRHIPTVWPGEQVVEKLVRKSSGQFIFASTAAKYISSLRHRPADRLDVILGLRERASDKDIPFAALDALYCQIFSAIPEENMETVRNIFGLLIFNFMYNSFNLDALCPLLSLSLEDIDFYLMDVVSVVWWNDKNIRITHASLSDFLLNQRRSGNYYLERRTLSTSIVNICIRNFNRDATEKVMQVSLRTFKSLCDEEEQIPIPDLQDSLLALSLDPIYNWSLRHGSWLDYETDLDGMDNKDSMKEMRELVDFSKFTTSLFNFLETLPINRDILDPLLKEFDQCMMKLISEAIDGYNDVLLITTLTAIRYNFRPSWAITSGRCVMLSFSRIRPFLKTELPKFSPAFKMLYDFCASTRWTVQEFFKNPLRSGPYALTDTRFADAALACLVFLCQNEYGLGIVRDLGSFPKAFISAYHAIIYLPQLLPRSAASQQLIAFIRSGEFEMLWEETRILFLREVAELDMADVEPRVRYAIWACKEYIWRTNPATANLLTRYGPHPKTRGLLHSRRARRNILRGAGMITRMHLKPSRHRLVTVYLRRST